MNRVGHVYEKYPEELKLLLSFLGADNDRALPLLILRNYPAMNWDRFLELCAHHRVYPLVYRNIKADYAAAVPEHVLESLKQEYRLNTMMMLKLVKEMEILVQAFRENGIRVLIIKGPLLGKELYGDISLRTSKDLDILVPPDDLQQADEQLRKLGYVSEGTTDLVERHHSSYFDPLRGVEVELHWRLEPERSREPSFDDMWSRKAVSSLSTYPIYYLGKEDLLFSLVTHGFRHGWFRLRWLLDIDVLLKKQPDWTAVMERITVYKYERELAQVIVLLNQLLRTPTAAGPAGIVPSRRSKRFAVLAANVINGTGKRRYRFARSKLKNKIGVIMTVISPQAEDIEALRLPKLLYFLYYALRPFLWSWRRMSRRLQR